MLIWFSVAPHAALRSDPERERIVAVLSACEGSRTLAAEQLGMSRHALRNRLIKYG